MTYPIVVCVVAIEALILLSLWSAVRMSISRLARPLVAASGVSGAWGAWILVVVVRGPTWMMALTLSVIALSSVGMAVAIHLATCDPEARPDGGAGGAPRPDPEAPLGGGGDGEPPWWPDFERQLATYDAQRERQRQPVGC